MTDTLPEGQEDDHVLLSDPVCLFHIGHRSHNYQLYFNGRKSECTYRPSTTGGVPTRFESDWDLEDDKLPADFGELSWPRKQYRYRDKKDDRDGRPSLPLVIRTRIK